MPLARSLAAVAALVVLAGCQSGTAPAPSPTVAPSPHATRARKFDMGGDGEVRKPQPYTLEQRLLEAVRQNDRASITRAVELGAALTSKDDLARSTVLLATLDAGDLELVRWLHEQGVPLDEPDAGGRTALSFAADTGRLPIVQYLLEQGAAVDSRDVQQRTPLLHAAGADHPDVIAFLLDHHADVNARDQFGDTPLIVACGKGNVASATLLIARGADATVADQEGRTAKQRSAPEAAPCLALPR